MTPADLSALRALADGDVVSVEDVRAAAALLSHVAALEARVGGLEGERTALYEAMVGLVEWGSRGHNPNDIAPWIRATEVLKAARLGGKEGT